MYYGIVAILPPRIHPYVPTNNLQHSLLFILHRERVVVVVSTWSYSLNDCVTNATTVHSPKSPTTTNHHTWPRIPIPIIRVIVIVVIIVIAVIIVI